MIIDIMLIMFGIALAAVAFIVIAKTFP